jgi:hypothetical protein
VSQEHADNEVPGMSQMGQARRFSDVRRMSGLTQTADISGPDRHFAFGPGADMMGDIDRRCYRRLADERVVVSCPPTIDSDDPPGP